MLSETDAWFSQNYQCLYFVFVFLFPLLEILDFLPTAKQMIKVIHIHVTLYSTQVQFPRLGVMPKQALLLRKVHLRMQMSQSATESVHKLWYLWV